MIKTKIYPVLSELDESNFIRRITHVWQVTRVATGWIYQNVSDTKEGYFVPLTTYSNTNV